MSRIGAEILSNDTNIAHPISVAVGDDIFVGNKIRIVGRPSRRTSEDATYSAETIPLSHSD